MFGKLKAKASSITGSTRDFASSAKQKLGDSGLSEAMLSKARNINLEVISNWTKDSSEVDDRSISDKLKESAKKVGEELYVLVMQAYLAMTDNDTAIRHKAILGAGLAYFVLPTDIIPDVIAGVGFTDDIAALALSAKNVGDSIQEKHIEEAKRKWSEFVGSTADNTETLIEVKEG